MNLPDKPAGPEDKPANQCGIGGKCKRLLAHCFGYLLAAFGFILFAIVIGVYEKGFKFLEEAREAWRSGTFWMIIAVTAFIMGAYLAVEDYLKKRKSKRWRRRYHLILGIAWGYKEIRVSGQREDN
jgi:hypothetical protein